MKEPIETPAWANYPAEGTCRRGHTERQPRCPSCHDMRISAYVEGRQKWIVSAAEEIASSPECCDIQSSASGAMAVIIFRHFLGLRDAVLALQTSRLEAIPACTCATDPLACEADYYAGEANGLNDVLRIIDGTEPKQ